MLNKYIFFDVLYNYFMKSRVVWIILIPKVISTQSFVLVIIKQSFLCRLLLCWHFLDCLNIIIKCQGDLASCVTEIWRNFFLNSIILVGFSRNLRNFFPAKQKNFEVCLCQPLNKGSI